MTKFTKILNFIFRGSVVIAFGTTLMEIVSGSKLFTNLIDGSNDAEAVLAKVSGLDFTTVLGDAQMVSAVLVITTILSVMAFKSSGKIYSILRSIVLFVLGGLSVIGSYAYNMADVLVRNLNGAVTPEELEAVKPILEAVSSEGEVPEMAAGTFLMAGSIISGVIGVVLLVLVVTSIVSIVKAAKAETT